jgi:hypothetical protein
MVLGSSLGESTVRTELVLYGFLFFSFCLLLSQLSSGPTLASLSLSDPTQPLPQSFLSLTLLDFATGPDSTFYSLTGIDVGPSSAPPLQTTSI